MATESAKYLSTLHKQIDQYFSFSEVRTLCFDLGVDFENIPGDIRSAFIRNLIISLAKQNRLQELVNQVRLERPFVNWQDVPADFELPTSMAQENIQQVVNYHLYGDYVGGDKITVGNIENAQGVAIGRGAAANVQQEKPTAAPMEQPSPPPAAVVTVQQAVDRVKIYLQMVSPERQDAAAEMVNGLDLILNLVAEQPFEPLLLKLACLGQQQLANQLSSEAAGIDQAVAVFVAAVFKMADEQK